MSCTDNGEPVTPSPTLYINAQPTPSLSAFSEGVTLRMIYGREVPAYMNKWIRLETVEGEVLLAGIDSDALDVKSEHKIFPYDTSFAEDVCEVDTNYVDARLSVNFDDGKTTHTIFDNTFAKIELGMQVWVSALDINEDFPGSEIPEYEVQVGMIYEQE